MFGSAARESSPDGIVALATELNAAAMDGDDERVKQLLGRVLDCPEQVAALEELFYAIRTMAVTDELTGVYNRRGFDWVAGRLLRRLCQERRSAVLMYVDIDNLKTTNDTVGHAAGDRLLAAAGTVLRTVCGEGSVVGRIGGDEFALLARQSGAENQTLLRQRLQSAIAACNATGVAPNLSMSIGAADFDPLRPASVRCLLEQADRAMYAQKMRKNPPIPFVAAPARLALAANSG